MLVVHLIDEAERKVPVGAPVGTRHRAGAIVTGPEGTHRVDVVVRIDAKGRRREQWFCDGTRVERHVLLRLTCTEAECPQARAVRTQWAGFHGWHRSEPQRPTAAGPLIDEVQVVVAHHHCVARPARFPCHTVCPNGAHPPLTIDKSGYDLFEDGVCLGGGIVDEAGARRPRLPDVRAVEAFVLARRLEALAALAEIRESPALGDGAGRTPD